MFLLLPVMLILIGCYTFPWYSGTFIGHAEKVELCSTNGQSFAVAVLRIETTKGIRTHGGYCWLDVEKNEPWSRAGWTKAILVDASNVACSADSYVGKILKVTAETRGGRVYPFVGGPSLEVPEANTLLRSAGILRAKRIEVVDSVAMEKWLSARRAATLSKSKMVPPYVGTFIGRAEKGELYLRDGKIFLATKFTVESTKGKVESSPNYPWKLEWHPTVFLADRSGTGYRANGYAGKVLSITGRIVDGTPGLFHGGPWVSPQPPPKPDAEQKVSRWERIFGGPWPPPKPAAEQKWGLVLRVESIEIINPTEQNRSISPNKP